MRWARRGHLDPVVRNTRHGVADGAWSTEARLCAKVGNNGAGVVIAGRSRLGLEKCGRDGRGDRWGVGRCRWKVGGSVLGYQSFNSSTQDSHRTRTASETQATNPATLAAEHRSHGSGSKKSTRLPEAGHCIIPSVWIT